MKFADTLSREYLIECFWEKLLLGENHISTFSHLLMKVLSSTPSLSKATQCPRVQQQQPVCRQIPQVASCWGGWTHCSNNRESLPKSQRCLRLQDVSIQTKKTTRRKVVSALLNRSNSQLVTAMHHNTIRHFYLFVYFESSPPKEQTATHNSTYACACPLCTTQGFFHFFPFAGKKNNSLHFSHMYV